MDLEQLERLREVDRMFELGTGQPLDETMVGLRALMAWVLEVDGRICCEPGEDSGIRVPSNGKVMPPDVEVSFEKNWGILIGFLGETDRVLRRAVESEQAADWEVVREALVTWFSWGVSPLSLTFKKEDGTELTWFFELLGDDVAGHRADGELSFLWSRERGLEWWCGDLVVN